MKEEFEDIEIYPVEASALGTNAYYINCGVAGHHAPYASCLMRIEQRKQGRLDIRWSDCSAAIGKKECSAQKLRKEELAEGRAIYFINRKKYQSWMQYRDEMTATALSSDRAPKRQRFVAPKETPPESKRFIDIDTGSYADALNAALSAKDLAVATKAPVVTAQQKPTPAAPVKAGMSLLEMARMQLATTKL